MSTVTLNKTLPVKAHYDIIVCGGGISGCAAAVTAAQRGKKVLLIEKSNILGGLATLGLINIFVPMCNGRGKQIIFGLAEKWVRDSTKYGYDSISEEWRDGEPKEYTEKRYRTVYSPYIFALQLTEEVRASGADLLFDCIACDPVMEGKVCRGVVTESKSGTEYYSCDMLIDVTGDCDVLRRGGVPTVSGKNYFTYIGFLTTLELCAKAVEKQDIKRIYKRYGGGTINLYGDGQPADVPQWSGLTTEEVSDYISLNHRTLLDKLRNDERNSRDIISLPLMPQFRTTCHIDGDYTFRVTDAYKHFEDSVCAINDFDNADHLFEIPLRALCRHDFPNMLTAGRSASAEGYGWDVLRVIPPAIITGQAAAEAACLAIDMGVGVADVDIKRLQAAIESDNIMVHFPDSYLPEDRTVRVRGVSQDGHF